LELLGGAGHPIAAAHAQDLNKTHVEEDTLEDDIEGDQLAQQLAIVLRRARAEPGIGEVL